jgi:hypothetical protein
VGGSIVPHDPHWCPAGHPIFAFFFFALDFIAPRFFDLFFLPRNFDLIEFSRARRNFRPE